MHNSKLWQIEELITQLNENDHFVLITHVSPDGDAIGSSIALFRMLRSLNKKVCFVCDGDIPANLTRMKDTENMSRDLPEGFVPKVAIAVDCADYSRLGSMISIFDNAPLKIVIDHHISNDGFGQINCIDSECAATGEIIYSIAKAMDLPLDKNIAEALYIALISDTGNFSYSNTTGNTMRVAGDLVEAGINLSGIQQALFHERTLEKTRLIGHCMVNAKMYLNNTLAISWLTWEERKALAAETETGGVVEMLRDIQGVEVAVFAKENENGEYKVSLRSKEFVDVCEIAINFEGGGHKRAAAFASSLPADEIERHLIGTIAEACAQHAKEMELGMS